MVLPRGLKGYLSKYNKKTVSIVPCLVHLLRWLVAMIRETL